MATSSAVASDAAITAAQFNALRTDVLNSEEMYFQCTFATDFQANGAWAVGRLDATAEVAMVTFFAPVGFTAATMSKAVIIATPQASDGAAEYSYSLHYGTNAESHAGTHTGADTSTTYAATDGTVLEINIAGQLGSIAAGDYVGITVAIRDASHHLDVHGVLIRWASASAPQAVVANATDDAKEYRSLRSCVLESREMFVPVIYAEYDSSHASSALDPIDKTQLTGSLYSGASVEHLANGYISFIAPTGFDRVAEAALVVISKSGPTRDHTFVVNGSYAASGETVVASGDIDHVQSMALNGMYDIDCTSALTGVRAGDYVGLEARTRLPTNASSYILGLRFRWTNSEASTMVRNFEAKTAAQFNNLRTDMLGMREAWYPAVLGASGGALANYNGYPVVALVADTDEAFVTFSVPTGYTAIDELVLVLRTHTTRTIASWNVQVGAVATGEALANPVTATFTPSVTANQIIELDLSGSSVFDHSSARLAAGDRACVRFYLGDAADDVDVLGVRFKWT